MKAFSKRALILSAILVSCSSTSAWSSNQIVWEDENKAKTQKAKNQVTKIRKDSYSVQLSSFSISSEKKGSVIASEELDRLTNAAKQKGYDLSKHDLFAMKVKNDNNGYCAIGSFGQLKDAELLCTYLGTIFSSNPFVKEPTNIDKVPLDFVLYRPKK